MKLLAVFLCTFIALVSAQWDWEDEWVPARGRPLLLASKKRNKLIPVEVKPIILEEEITVVELPPVDDFPTPVIDFPEPILEENFVAEPLELENVLAEEVTEILENFDENFEEFDENEIDSEEEEGESGAEDSSESEEDDSEDYY